MAVLPFLLLLLSSPIITAYPYKLCEGDYYSSNNTFESNLLPLLSSLSSKNSTFSIDTKGSPPNTVYSLFLCRGDINLSACHNCIEDSIQNIVPLCPNSKEATVWYDTCQLRYADSSFFSSYHNAQVVRDSNEQKAMDPDTFDSMRKDLLDKLSHQAAYNSTLMFATGEALSGGDELPEIYGLVQCTRDLSKGGCYNCLQENLRDSLQYFNARIGGRLLAKSCNFRYETNRFFQAIPTISLSPNQVLPPPQSPPTKEEDGKGSRNIIIISIVIPVVVAFLLILSACVLFRRRSANYSHGGGGFARCKICLFCCCDPQAAQQSGMANLEELTRPQSLYFDLSMLRIATANFSDINKLGQGGFGAVYKGMLPNGQEIAVKRLSASSNQGMEELKNELLLVAKLQHRNLVRLQGVCLEEGEKLLVYEYMPNGSLDHFLFDPIKCKELNWERRFKIIGGIARGLLYLHEESHLKVVHRDLKASNVLLDANMKPKISDFGLARLFEGDQTRGITNRVVGTFGYMAPEYARRGQFSTKLDVYSYGILVLEIITGRKNSFFKYDSESGQDILSYTWRHWRKGTTLEIIDPSLFENYSRIEALRCVQIGLLCAQQFAAHRPLMSSVFLMLNSPSMPLEDPVPPTYLAGLSTVESDVSSSSKYPDMYSTSSIGSSQQSGSSITPIPPQINQKVKEMGHSDITNNQAFSSRIANDLPS